MTAERRAKAAVVVPAIDAASPVACLRSLGRRGVETIGVSEQASTPAFRSRYCAKTAVVPSPAEDLLGYKDALLSFARRSGVRAIIPLREEDVYVLANYRGEFAEHLVALWPSIEKLRTVHDRVRLIEAARTAGVSVPETRVLGEVDSWEREQVLKPRYALVAGEYVPSFSPDRCLDVGSATYLRPGVEPDTEAIRGAMYHDPIVQEYVPGEEYSLWALYDHGDAVATCGMHQHRAYKYAGGTSIYRETVRIPELEAAGRALLDELDWHGLASVQFVRDTDSGAFTLMEVNPRFWLSLPCAIRAGIDFPYYYWRLANGESVREGSTYEAGVGTHLLRGEAVYLYSVLRTENPYVAPPPFRTALREVLASLYDQPQFDYLSLDDPGPFLRDALNTAAALL